MSTSKQLITTVEDLEARGIGFRSLTEAIDTTTNGGRLVFHIFAALAEFERGIIRERTMAGLEAAKARTDRRTAAGHERGRRHGGEGHVEGERHFRGGGGGAAEGVAVDAIQTPAGRAWGGWVSCRSVPLAGAVDTAFPFATFGPVADGE